MSLYRHLFFGLLAVVVLVGCSRGIQEKTYTIKTTPLDQAKALLKNYAQGGPLGSEAASFPNLVEEVRKTDPAKADILKQGFDELEKAGPALAAKAKEILGKL